MRVIQQRINEIGRLIKKYKNMARAANQQRKWREEKRWIEKISALNGERKNLEGQTLSARSLNTPVSSRLIKKINVLLNEIKRDTRILGIHKADNNVPGIKKYENILKNKKAKLATLQGRIDSPELPKVDNSRKVRILLNEIKRDRRILALHEQAGNAAGVGKYKAIIQSQLMELARLRGSSSGSGNSGGSGSGSGDDSGTSVSEEIRKIAGVFKNSTRGDREVDTASSSVIDHLLETRFGELKSARQQLFTLKNNTTPPPPGSVIDQPFIRDIFKIFQSNILLKDYTVKDSIIDSEFMVAFDQSVNAINTIAGTVSGNQKKVQFFKKLAHRDAFQLIPQDSQNISKAWSQFAGAKLSDITMENISIHSDGSLQGIFSSDGAFENLHFKNISVDTQSAHQITILGMLSGTLDLTNNSGEPVKVNLLPLRLGGGRNIYIKSFSDRSSYQYGEIDSGNSNANISDNRKEKTKSGKYYINFDMDKFIQLIRIEPKDNLSEFLDHIESSAEQSGELDS